MTTPQQSRQFRYPKPHNKGKPKKQVKLYCIQGKGQYMYISVFVNALNETAARKQAQKELSLLYDHHVLQPRHFGCTVC